MKMPGMSRSRRRYSSDQAPPLINAVIEMEADPVTGSTQLHEAIQLQPDLDERDNDGFTALMYAIRLNLPNAVSDLVKLGATVNLKDEDGNTPFFYACLFKYWSVMETLLKEGADPEIHNQNGLTVLLTAIEAQDEELVERLLKLCASPNNCSVKGTPSLVLALSHKHLHYNMPILHSLLKAGADVNMADRGGLTPLMQACHPKRRYTEVVQLLIEWKAKVNLRDSQGRTALHYCLQDNLGNSHCQRLLLKAGVSCNVADTAGNTPLSLLGHGYKSSLSDSKHDSIMLKSLRKLLSCGADPNLVTATTSPVCLVRAVLGCSCVYEAVRLFLAAGAEPISCEDYSQEKDFNTLPPLYSSPLMAATESGKLDTARLLVDGLFYTHLDAIQFSTNVALNASTISQVLSAATTLSSPTPTLQTASSSNSNTIATGAATTEAAVTVANVVSLNNNVTPPVSVSAASSIPRSIWRAALQSTPSTTTLSRVSSLPSMTTASPVMPRRPLGNSDNNYRSTTGSISGTTVSNHTNRVDQDGPATIPNQYRTSLNRTHLHSGSSTSQNNVTSLQPFDVQEIASSITRCTPSLQQLCRRVIHRAMGCRPDKAKRVKDLPIWPKLQRYILFHGSEYSKVH